MYSSFFFFDRVGQSWDSLSSPRPWQSWVMTITIISRQLLLGVQDFMTFFPVLFSFLFLFHTWQWLELKYCGEGLSFLHSWEENFDSSLIRHHHGKRKRRKKKCKKHGKGTPPFRISQRVTGSCDSLSWRAQGRETWDWKPFWEDSRKKQSVDWLFKWIKTIKQSL